MKTIEAYSLRRICEQCGRSYMGTARQRWCSPGCKALVAVQIKHIQALHKPKVYIRLCAGCGKPLHPNNLDVTCSPICDKLVESDNER